MPIEVVNQDSVLDRALDLVGEAKKRIWLTSPWITGRAVNLLLRKVLPQVTSGALDIRIVYRVKEPTDLEITDLDALKSLEDAGCAVKYSTRLHAKLVLVDDATAIVSSSNLTATAGYSVADQANWRNEELGILIRDEPATLADLERQFTDIWQAASSVEAETIGIVMDFPNAHTFSFVAIREVQLGEYATARDASNNVAIGRIAGVTAYNRSFPQMNQTMWLTQGYAAPGEPRRGGMEVPDLQSLFSHPSKEHGFLVTKTFFEPESVFHIAQVEVLKHVHGARLVSPGVPVVPGSDVSRASPGLLKQLMGSGDLSIGTVLHHSEVDVALIGEEIISKHLAVLGMTGSGKSNAVKVLIRQLLSSVPYSNVRVVIIDTHGEYAPIASAITPNATLIDVGLRDSILDEAVVRELLRLPRRDEALLQQLWEAADHLPEGAGLEDLLTALEADISLGGAVAARLRRLIEAVRARSDLCLWPEDGARIVRVDGNSESLNVPGLYVLDLRSTAELELRSAKAAAVMRQLFLTSKESGGAKPALVVVDEAQNYAPEQQTGWLTRVRPSFDMMFSIASEGRKFNVGLVVSTQRPARVNKDILSQCNTHMIFRVANVEDLAAIAGSFEAASQPLLAELPGFDTGVCVVGGAALGMVTRVEVPLFDHSLGVDV